VVDGVGDEVLESVGDAVQHLLVELDVVTDELEPDVLAGRGGDLTAEPREAGENAVQRHHRQPHRLVAHLVDAAVVALDQLAHLRRRGLQLVAERQQAPSASDTVSGRSVSLSCAALRSSFVHAACSAIRRASRPVVSSTRRAPSPTSPTTSIRS
jgi:hypothetical protein